MAEEAVEVQQTKAAPKRVPLKRGDYQIHFFLEEARSLMGLEEGDTVDPIVSIKAFGKSKATKAKDDVGGTAAIYYGEHFFFDGKKMEVEDVETAKILIEVRDHRFLLSNSLVGSYEMDLTYVYYQEKHALVHKWIALSNAESEEFQEIRGYLKFGVSVLGEGDEQVDLTFKEQKETQDSDLLLPPQIELQTCQLKVTFLKAEGLPKMDDWGGTCDAMCYADFAGKIIKTQHVKADEATFSAYWYQEGYIPVTLPCVTGRLIVRLEDWDSTSSNDLIGTVTFRWVDIEAGMYSNYFWANIYGAPLETSGENTDFMNRHPNLASYWRGRILLRVQVEPSDKPKLAIEDIPGEEIRDLVKGTYEQGPEYELRVQLHSGSALPKKWNSYKVAVRWGDVETESQEVDTKNGQANWYENLPRKVAYFPSNDLKQLPDIFVYLRDGDDNVCYFRLEPENQNNFHAKATWFQFKPDKAEGTVSNDWEGGFLRIRVAVGVYGDYEDTMVSGAWNVTPNPPPPQNHTLLCNLYQCRNLPATDSDARADPYVIFYCNGQQVQTDEEEKEDTLNPMWYRPLALSIQCANLADAPPLVIYVMDHDVLDADDLMGMIILPLDDAVQDSPEPARPKWYPLSMGKPGSGMGEILVSFNLFSHTSIPNYSLIPQTIDTTIEINVLGLRDLVPALGWVPVNKAFLKFDLNSLQIPGEALKVRNVQTQPSEPGANPNINTVLKFRVKMAVDPLFCPTLSCGVYDYLFMGMSQPLIGTFTIDLGEHFHNKKAVKAKLGKIGAQVALKGVAKVSNQPDLLIDEADPRQVKILPKKDYEMKPLKPAVPPSSSGAAGISQVNQERMPQPLSIRRARKGLFVRKPIYQKNPNTGMMEEINVPDPNFYMAIGYDRHPGQEIMHYRYVVPSELEESNYMDPSPFLKFDVRKGKDMVEGDMDKQSIEQTGLFKGLVRITQQEQVMQNKEKVKTLRNNREKNKAAIKQERVLTQAKMMISSDSESELTDDSDEDFEEITKQLLVKQECLVRLYIIDAFDLAQRDERSLSDPYVLIKLGKKTVGDPEQYQTDKTNCGFYKMYEIEAVLPGASQLKIQVYDHDDIFADELIGTTKIDLEDRFFSNKWQKLMDKPIETRTLFHKSTKLEQGTIRMWMEIVSKKEKIETPIWDISPRPPSDFEARLIVWKTEDVSTFDVEGTSDIYIRAWVNASEPKETDCHYRCQNGEGSFNWRMLFPITIPFDIYRVNIQIWDRDILSFNDFIADATFTFDALANDAWTTNRRVKRRGAKDESIMNRVRGAIPSNEEGPNNEGKFWISCMKRNENRELEPGGRVQVSFELMPKAQAEACPVGEGRDDPNIDPFLPPPIGRIQWSWNPFDMIAQMCGKSFRYKMYCAICCILCCVLCVMMVPMLFSDTVAIILFE